MATYTIVYDTDQVADGYIAYCTANPTATAFGKTEEEAADNLVEAIDEYLKLYPEKVNKLLTVSTRKLQVAD